MWKKYAKIWTLLKMYTWNEPPCLPCQISNSNVWCCCWRATVSAESGSVQSEQSSKKDDSLSKEDLNAASTCDAIYARPGKSSTDILFLTTGWPKKTKLSLFVHIFAKYWPILTIFFTSRLCREFATHWHAHHTYVATLPCKTKISENQQYHTAEGWMVN